MVGGAVVGYITNYIALKWIFEPLNPTKVGPFIIQGMFLTRQKEVSAEFSSYITDNVLTSQEVWKQILSGTSLEKFKIIIARNVPFMSGNTINAVVSNLQTQLLGTDGASHPLHFYTNRRLNLKATLINRMNRLTPTQFEQVLHPIFQEDELILIVAGGVLGAIAGGLQWWLNSYMDQRKAKVENIKRLEIVNPPKVMVIEHGIEQEDIPEEEFPDIVVEDLEQNECNDYIEYPKRIQ